MKKVARKFITIVIVVLLTLALSQAFLRRI